MAKQWKIMMTIIAVSLAGMLWACAPLAVGAAPKPVVAVVVAFENYSIVQYQEMYKALQESGIPFDIASTQMGQAKSGGHQVEIDHRLTELDLDRYEAIVFLGGFGALDDLIDNPNAITSIQRAAAQGKVVGGS